MHFTDNINIPDKLINSLAENKLVVFVGAGVSSRAYPQQHKKTYYPLFEGLVREIAQRLDKVITPVEKNLMKKGFSDQILGQWCHEEHKVYNFAAEILQENENEKRINLHKAIIQLFPNMEQIKIVTTNFDNLLVRAMVEIYGIESKCRIYEAPALPPGHRISGLCFLHGKVTKPNEMILTDKDIGKAYMDEGWALKFSHGLFKNFHVLFIGYSLNDPPLRYLNLAMQGTIDINRWSFLKKPKDVEKCENIQKEWDRLGVELIWYPSNRNDYREIENCIYLWSKNNHKGYIEKRNFLQKCAESKPLELLNYDLDLVTYYLKEPELLRDFVSIDLEDEWLDKLVEWKYCLYLLLDKGERTNADYFLAEYISKLFIKKPIECMIKLMPFRKTLNSLLFDRYLHNLEKSNIEDQSINNLRKTFEFFRFSMEKEIPHFYYVYIEKILKQLIKKGNFNDAIWLFTQGIEISSNIKQVQHQTYFEDLLRNGNVESVINQNTIQYDLIFKNNIWLHRINDLIKSHLQNSVLVPGHNV